MVSGQHTVARMLAPPAGNGHSTELVRLDLVRSEQALDHCLICASPLPLGGSFTRLWRHVLPHGSGPPYDRDGVSRHFL